MRYPVILFDIGETLVGPGRSFGAVYSRALETLGLRLEADRLETCIRETSDEMRHTIPSGTDRFSYYAGGEREFWHRFFESVLERAGATSVEPGFVADALARVREAFREPSAWEVYRDVTPMLEALRRAGARLGVVSNWDSRLPDVLERLGLAGYFDTIGVSAVERVEKPDPVFFRRVLERLGALPEQALHVGNVPELDLEGARAAGIDGLLVDRTGAVDPSYRPLADLTDLPRIAEQGLRYSSNSSGPFL